MQSITPVLMAGGSGTRLWPTSRKSYPKQFATFFDEYSLFQRSVLRMSKSELLSFDKLLTITHSDYRFIVAEQLQKLEIEDSKIILEPESKNTAAAILAVCSYVVKESGDKILLIAPSDHVIPDDFQLHSAIKAGLSHVKNGKIVLFGIKPTRAETGYGYIELDNERGQNLNSPKRFIEKPTKDVAEVLINSGNTFWNSGIFLAKASDLLASFELYNPELLNIVKLALEHGVMDLDFFRLDPENWNKCTNISIDYAILEKAKNLKVVPYEFEWSDLGDWNAIWESTPKDDKGNATTENTYVFDCNNTLVRSDKASMTVVASGLNNVALIATHDAVLAIDKSKSQDVKNAVAHLKKMNLKQAESHLTDYRPWGSFESLAIDDRFQVKRIIVEPKGSLSLQSHNHRSEHWIVVKGTARVVLDGETKLITEGQSIYIPLGSKHRLENPGKLEMILIEVQTGPYLEEDDIIRYEDIYKRS